MEAAQVVVDRYKAEQLYKSAAGWFWWIGGLSVVNSLTTLSGNQFTFTFGLGISQIGDVWLAGESGILWALGFLLSFGSSGLFLLLAWLARHTTAALPLGVGFYAADALIFLLAQDWLGLGFHAFALLLIVNGWRASKRALAALPPPAPVTADSVALPSDSIQQNQAG
jgi:hypothetical protein